jgi:TonB family protein
MNNHKRALSAIIISLLLHFAVFSGLYGFVFSEPVKQYNAPQSDAGFTVSFMQSASKEVQKVKNTASKNEKRGAFRQSTHAAGAPSAAIVLPGGYYSVRELDVIPVITRDVNVYPKELNNQQGMVGKVVIGIWIDEVGHVVKYELVKSELPENYGEVVARAFSQAEFQPGLKNGIAVKSRVRVVVVYSTQKQAR